MVRGFDEINDKLDRKADKADIEDLKNVMHDFIKQIVDNNEEQAVRDVQWHRLIEWAHKVSEKTGIPLPDL